MTSLTTPVVVPGGPPVSDVTLPLKLADPMLIGLKSDRGLKSCMAAYNSLRFRFNASMTRFPALGCSSFKWTAFGIEYLCPVLG